MRRILLALLIVGVLVAGCTPASQAVNWAEKAEGRGWEAAYRVVFHQEDGDLEFMVTETWGETLLLDIKMPSGTLTLEYTQDDLIIDLDGGSLEWTDFSRQAPYYTMLILSQQILAHTAVETDSEWAVVGDFRLTLEGDVPSIVKFSDQWTLTVDSFHWR